MGWFLVFQRHGCETRCAGLAAVPLKNEVDFGRWRSINMAPLRGFISAPDRFPRERTASRIPVGKIRCAPNHRISKITVALTNAHMVKESTNHFGFLLECG